MQYSEVENRKGFDRVGWKMLHIRGKEGGGHEYRKERKKELMRSEYACHLAFSHFLAASFLCGFFLFVLFASLSEGRIHAALLSH